jgi:segregation and condensation protein A
LPEVNSRLNAMQVRVPTFEGPLDLLLYLIQSHELDISKVTISKVTDQYLAYVRAMQVLDFDVASEFLVLAATLLFWKSRALLPQDKAPTLSDAADAEIPLTPEELIRQLQEHRRYLAAGQDLAKANLLGDDVFARPNGAPAVERVWRQMSLSDLTLSMQDVLTFARRRKTVLKKETVSLTDRILQFGNRLALNQPTLLRDLMSLQPDKPEVVVTFLASLELGRLKKLKLYQQDTYQDIFVELVETLQGLDTQLLTGFTAPLQQTTPN